MAQITQKTPPTQAKTAASASVDAAKPATRFRLPFKLPSFLSPNTADGTPRSGVSRLLTGMLVLFIGFYVINFLLSFIFSHLPRSAQDALSSPLASKNTFLLGGLSGVELIFFLAIGAFYIALFRFNIIPRDPFNSRARTEARVAANRVANSTVNLAPQTRASRRQAAAAATTAAANAKNGRNGKNTAKAPAPLIKTKAGQSTAASSATRAKPAALAAAQSGTHDAEYERVKALQRQQRRRDAKR